MTTTTQPPTTTLAPSTEYVLLDSSNNILYGPASLPTSWLNSDGTVTDLTMLDSDQLTALGWFYWVSMDSSYNPLGQTLSSPTLSFSSNTVTATYSVVDFDVTTIISNVCNTVNNYRDNILENNGFIWTDGNIYDCGQSARLNMAGAVVGALATNMSFPPGYTWRTMNNINVPFTAQQVVLLGLSVLEYYVQVLNTSWYHKDNLLALTDPSQVLSYDFTAGWPSNNLTPVTTQTPTTPPPTTSG